MQWHLCKCIHVIRKLEKLVNSLRNVDGEGGLHMQHILIGFQSVENGLNSFSN